MSTEESKRVASQFFATIGKGDIAALTEMADPECVGNFPGLRTNMNREQLIATISANQTAFPDLKADIQDQFAEGEKVVTRTAVRVTHGGPYYDVPATGNNVSWWGLRIKPRGRRQDHGSIRAGGHAKHRSPDGWHASRGPVRLVTL